ncbi:MAG: pyridoxamine 5'-phosphate oxidase family protein [Candidatus Jordarchaeales archaeon]
MMALPRGAVEAFNLEMAGKFLATAGGDGKPNVVPVISLRAFDEETLVFGEFMMLKTRKNLAEGCKVCACVVTEKLENYVATGVFKGFERRGKYYEFVSEIPLFKYNAYTGARAAGVIKVEEVWQVERAKSKAAILLDTLAAMVTPVSGGGKRLHPNISEKFNRLNAVKVVAKIEDGQPVIIPAISMRAVGGTKLVFGTRSTDAERLKPGEYVATAVLTMEAMAYQVKGVYEGKKRTLLGEVGVVSVEEAYTLTPPRPGEKIPLE